LTYDALKALETAGIPVASLNDAQRAVVAELAPDEVAVVTKINSRLAAAGTDVEGHMWVGVGIF
jgi:hypothetical protein